MTNVNMTADNWINLGVAIGTAIVMRCGTYLPKAISLETIIGENFRKELFQDF